MSSRVSREFCTTAAWSNTLRMQIAVLDSMRGERPFLFEAIQLRRVALVIVAAMVVLACVAIAFGQNRAIKLPPFLPAVVAAIVVTESISGYVFFGHYRTRRELRYLFFALAYACSGFIAIPYLLTFPGVFVPSGLFGATEQTALYLWLCWHALFPGLIIAGWFAGCEKRRPPRFGTIPVSFAALGGIAVFATVVTWALLRLGPDLPILVSQGVFSEVARYLIAPVICALDAAAIVLLLRDRRSTAAMSLWLVVSICASALDTIMGLLCARYSYGWYAGKIFSVASSTVILAAYVYEMLELQRRLSDAAHELRDLSEAERRVAQDQLLYLAYHDSMTGLLNRKRWQDLLTERAESIAQFGVGEASVLLIDLDNFKEVNDAFGHVEGDAILVEVAARLDRVLPEGSLIGRFDGDAFAVLLPEETSSQRFDDAARRILEAIRRPLWTEGRIFEVTASVGSDTARGPHAAAEATLQHADIALHHAKRAGGDRMRKYTEQMGQELERSRVLKEALIRAVRRGGLVLYYQPLMNLRSGGIHGVEALMRWEDPEYGLISPGTFIPLAEETGLMEAVGRWTLETAIAQARAWNELGFPLKISVNASVKQLQDSRFFTHLSDTLARHQVPPEQIEIEVTESVAMKDSERIIDLLARCRSLGVTIALDDYGTHYSSLTYLQRLPVDTIKIDGSFVQGLPGSDRDAAIIRSVITLGHELGKTIVAEGVETNEQLSWLRQSSCDVVQGFLFAKPMPSHEVVNWYRATAVYSVAS